jgi:hypothetical protein
MTKKKRRTFTTQQKAEILRRHLKDKVPVSDLCSKRLALKQALGLKPAGVEVGKYQTMVQKKVLLWATATQNAPVTERGFFAGTNFCEVSVWGRRRVSRLNPDFMMRANRPLPT